MSYTLIRDYLTKNDLVDPSDIYNIEKDDLQHFFEQLSNFCEENLREPETNEGIGDAVLFFYSDLSLNGRAFQSKGVKLIRLNMGVVVTLHDFFTSKQSIFTSGKLNRYKDLNDNLDVDISFLLYQISTLSIFYHEKAHLIQFTPTIQNFVEEYENNAQSAPYSLIHHVHEFDADCEAAYYCTLHLLDYWKRLPEEMRTQENLESLLSLGMASVVSYWVFLAKNKPDIYYTQSTHPHPLVRFVYAVDVMSNTASKNVPEGMEIRAEKVMRDAIEISDTLFQSVGDDRLAQFGANFNAESDNIEKYVNDLIHECEAYPNLVRNRRK